MIQSIVWLRRLVFEYGSSPPISLDLCADDEDPSQLIIRPGWDAPHVRCFPRTFCAWPCLLRQVGTVPGSPYDYVVARLAYANPGSRHRRPSFHLPPLVVAGASRGQSSRGVGGGGVTLFSRRRPPRDGGSHGKGCGQPTAGAA